MTFTTNTNSLIEAMSGVVFVVCIPTANYEQYLLGNKNSIKYHSDNSCTNNISDEAYRLEVELRDKNDPERIPLTFSQGYTNEGFEPRRCSVQRNIGVGQRDKNANIPLEKVKTRLKLCICKKSNFKYVLKILDELLKKLEIEHVVWCGDKGNNYYEVIFPSPAGNPCENLLHCLTELGIGKKLNSVVR